jgi:hypothetical protein
MPIAHDRRRSQARTCSRIHDAASVVQIAVSPAGFASRLCSILREG